jgi:hypothetical protein
MNREFPTNECRDVWTVYETFPSLRRSSSAKSPKLLPIGPPGKLIVFPNVKPPKLICTGPPRPRKENSAYDHIPFGPRGYSLANVQGIGADAKNISYIERASFGA